MKASKLCRTAGMVQQHVHWTFDKFDFFWENKNTDPVMGAKLNSKTKFPKRFFYFSNRFVCLWQKVLIIFEPKDANIFSWSWRQKGGIMRGPLMSILSILSILNVLWTQFQSKNPLTELNTLYHHTFSAGLDRIHEKIGDIYFTSVQ